jgi:hypothetical protein
MFFTTIEIVSVDNFVSLKFEPLIFLTLLAVSSEIMHRGPSSGLSPGSTDVAPLDQYSTSSETTLQL